MASLQSSFTAIAATTNSPFRKPSQLGSRRSHGRFQVSCSSGGGGSDRIDRRNMLLGVGGLYGGDYKLPKFPKPRVRPAAHRLTPEYVRKYELAIQMMKDLDVTDPKDPRGFTQQANVHCAYCSGPYDQVDHPGIDIQIHNSWIFFPFHRWYLYFFERIMGELIGDPDFALPYWNWDNPRGMQMPSMFDRDASPLYDLNRDQMHRPPAAVALALTNPPITDPLQIISNNLTQMYKEMIGDVESAIDFMGD